jgi:hypothetical protein
MKKEIFTLFALILLSFSNSSCKNEPNTNTAVKGERLIKTTDKNETLAIQNVDSLLNSSKDRLVSKKWDKIENSIVNDEYSEWLESTFFYSKEEWVKISFSDSIGNNINFLESNYQKLLDDFRLRIGDRLKDIILDKNVLLNLDDYGVFIIEIRNLTLRFDCGEKITDELFQRLITVKKTQNISAFPKELENCKLVSFLIFKEIAK